MDFQGKCFGPSVPKLAQLQHTLSLLVDSYCYSTNLERKSYLEFSSDMLCSRGEFGKEIFLVADIEELDHLDASEIQVRRHNAKEKITSKSGKHFIFPIADGTVKLSG